MDPTAMLLANVALDADGRIDQDVTCTRCGYNLRGLSPEGVCPECASPVGRSIQGDFLRFSSPDWVEGLASGMNWIVAGILIAILGACVESQAARATAQVNLVEVVILALGIVSVVGFWMVTAPDPAREQDEPWWAARSLARSSVVLDYALNWLGLGTGAMHPWLAAVLAVLIVVTSLVKMIAGLVYARQLALRIPDRKLATECRQIMWGWIILLVLPAVCFGGLGMAGQTGRPLAPWGNGLMVLMCGWLIILLILAIFTLLIVMRFRRQLSTAAMHARVTWAAMSAPPLPRVNS